MVRIPIARSVERHKVRIVQPRQFFPGHAEIVVQMRGDELRAAFLLAAKRGNYTDLSSFMEKRIFDSYQEAGNV